MVGYYTGPSQALVQLVNINKMEKKPIMNVVARIPGLEESDQTIIVGKQKRFTHDNLSLNKQTNRCTSRCMGSKCRRSIFRIRYFGKKPT